MTKASEGTTHLARSLAVLLDGLRALQECRYLGPHPAFLRYVDRERKVMAHAGK